MKKGHPHGHRSADPSSSRHPTGAADPAHARTSSGAPNSQSGTIEDAGVRAGEIVAWRLWRGGYRGRNNPRLFSLVVSDYEWALTSPNAVGDPDVAGVHALKEQSIAKFYAPRRPPLYGINNLILGRVALWGEVVEYEEGYCGEFAAVHSLDSIVGNENLLAELRSLYLPDAIIA